MPKWNVTIQEETDRRVRTFLARTGLRKGDLSSFVEDAVQHEMLRREAAALGEKDPSLSDEQALELARVLADMERSMDDVRAGRGQPAGEALQAIAREFGLRLDP